MMLVTDRYWGAAITSKQVEAVRAAVKAAAGRSFLAASDVGGSSYGTVDPEGAFVGLRREMVRAAAAAAEAERPGSCSFGFGSTDGEGEGAIVEWHSSSGLRSAVLPARSLADLGVGGGGGGAAPPPHHATAWARAQARAGALFWDLRLDGVIVNAQPAPLACNEDVFHALQWCRADNSQTASRVARADHDVAANPMAKIQGVGRKRGKLVAAVLAEQQVIVLAAHHPVIARSAGGGVIAHIAVDVVEVDADHDGVGAIVAAEIVGSAWIDDGVVTLSAKDLVIAFAAVGEICARAGVQRISAGEPAQAVVETGAG
jgi:hypothetical protein